MVAEWLEDMDWAVQVEDTADQQAASVLMSH